MAATGTPPYGQAVGSGDRLALALCLAIVAHALVILGVGFAPEPAPPPADERIEVLLVPVESSEAPPDADNLAQVNARASGIERGAEAPTTPMRTPAARPALEASIRPSAPARPTPPRATNGEVAEEARQASGTPTPRPAPAAAQAVVAAAPDPKAEPVDEAAASASAPAPEQTRAAAVQPQPDAPSAEELIARSLAVASLSARIDDRLQARAAEPRRKYISASTREYRYAAYLEAWRAKVERIGNLNYPEEARRRGLSGSLILEVVLLPDGSLKKVTVRRSSGHQVLDDAAVHIVRLAAPYAPFPPSIRREVDELHITRTWQFLNTARVTSR